MDYKLYMCTIGQAYVTLNQSEENDNLLAKISTNFLQNKLTKGSVHLPEHDGFETGRTGTPFAYGSLVARTK